MWSCGTGTKICGRHFPRELRVHILSMCVGNDVYVFYFMIAHVCVCVFIHAVTKALECSPLIRIDAVGDTKSTSVE